MARRGCKCRDGSYRVKCCTSTKRSNKVRSNSNKVRSNSNKKRQGGRDETPLEIIIERQRRRGKQIAYGGIIAGALYGVALIADEGIKAGKSTAAYGISSKSRKPAVKAVSKSVARRAAVRGAARGGARIAAGVAMRGIPILGQARMAYDLYTVVDYFLKGRLPYGARDRR